MFVAFFLMSALNHAKSNQQSLIIFYIPYEKLPTILAFLSDVLKS